ncbi:hypothetical protein B484DRAFT_442836 [Ochromonadaceae sp. CCMP2298]|nr:hypothetical protein B484DRAFT_442836 [Ochromonadaceae sp. CCMP2298]
MRSRITALEADRNSAARSLQLCVSILQASGEEAAAGGTELVSSLIVPGAGEIPEYTYTGQMRGGERHGLGGVTWATGSLKSYDGQWQEGKIHGQGIMVYSTPDDIYDGWFTDGKRNGQGSYTWIHGTSYKGQWQMGKKHGQGVYTYRNGDSEEGLWEANKRQGQFIFTKADGTRYSRVCKDDTRTSQTRIP